jgi:hypothetical protein
MAFDQDGIVSLGSGSFTLHSSKLGVVMNIQVLRTTSEYAVDTCMEREIRLGNYYTVDRP